MIFCHHEFFLNYRRINKIKINQQKKILKFSLSRINHIFIDHDKISYYSFYKYLKTTYQVLESRVLFEK